MAQIDDLLHLDAITVTGRTVGENIAGAEIVNSEVIRTRRDPLDEGGASSFSAATSVRTARS